MDFHYKILVYCVHWLSGHHYIIPSIRFHLTKVFSDRLYSRTNSQIGPYNIIRIENNKFFINRDVTEVKYYVSKLQSYIGYISRRSNQTQLIIYNIFHSNFALSAYTAETISINFHCSNSL